ncbi:MAG TPA: GAF domain-containing protein [Burkholderiales bacterium]|nr:GAF domain-containing protein [Burkholderiales bacterium]
MRLKPTDLAIGEHAAARRLHRGRLFRKYLLLILALVCGTLVISGGIGLYFSYEENKAALASLQREKAGAAAARIEQFVRQIDRQLEFAALHQLAAEGAAQRKTEFEKLLRIAEAVTDIYYIDRAGREQLFVSRLSMNVVDSGRDRSQEPAFRDAKPGQTWFGEVYFRKDTEPYIVMATRSTPGGPVAVGEINLKFIWDVLTRIRIGEKGKAYVVDSTGHLVADPDIGLVLRKTDLSSLEHVKRSLAPDPGGSPAMLSQDLGGGRVLTAYAPIDPLGWRVFAEQPVSEVFASLDAAILRTILLLFAGLLLSAFAAMWLARSMARPISTLRDGAARIGAGELEQKIEVKTGDELEALADEFNQMSARLRESYAGLERKVEARTAELQEALEQQTATAEILKVISSSTTDTQPVFEAIVQSGLKLFPEATVMVALPEGAHVRAAAVAAREPAEAEAIRSRFPVPLTREYMHSTAILDHRVIDVHDALLHDEPSIAPGLRNFIDSGSRAMTIIPMLRGGTAIGAISVSRVLPGPLSDKQMALLRTFADQAVIAIENVRLFNETKESLEQQTATSEILKVISRTTFDLQPVLEIVLAKARKLCEADRGFLFRPNERAEYVPMAFAVADEAQQPGDATRGVFDRAPIRLDRASATGRAVLDGVTVHIPDVAADPQYGRHDIMQAGNYRSILAVPMLRDGEPIGVLTLSRSGEARPFTAKQIELVRVFADQAVIAIENVRLFREIQEKSAQLEVANKHKSDFLANMSHELRTPLNAIIGFSEVLIERMFGEVNEKQLDYLKDIHESGKHLLSLINDILDLSKIEAGRMDLELSNFDLPSALSNAMTLVRERAQRHGIALGLEVDPRLGELRADERKFKQILLNLLSNAVKFTPDGGRVDVAARLDTDKVEIAVKDTGIGIASEDQASVFEEFKQVGRDSKRKAEGTGLGLALTKRFVELHGGAIRLDSSPGKGSTFTVVFPTGRS